MSKYRLIKYVLLLICLVCSGMEIQAEQPTLSLLQSSTVSLNMRNESLKDVFNTIEKQTELVFIYNNNDVDINKKVDVKATSESVESVLNKILGKTDIVYSVNNNKYIVLKRKTSETTESLSTNKVTQQKNEVSGVVKDENGEALIGVSVRIKNTTSGTMTDIDGKFSVPAPSGSTLIFSFLGYFTQEITVGSQKEIQVTMKEDTKALDEVVVVGFAVQRKVNMTGSVNTVKMDDIAGVRPVASTGSLLQGVVPGLQVTSGSGEPGGGLSMNIRGTTSINGGGPLILVDNVPFNGPLNMINPSDIDNISVLKDGGSAAIYGARGAYGVVLITTKRAKKGDKPRVTFTSNIAFTKPSELPEKASPLETVQAFKDAGYTSHRGRNVDTWIDFLNEYNADPSRYPDGYAFDASKQKYLLKEYDQIGDFLSETGFQQMHSATITGSAGKTAYRLSAGLNNSDGIMVTNRDNYKKYNVTGFVSTDVTSWLTAQLDMNYYTSKKGMPNKADYMLAVALPSYTPTGTVDINGKNYDVGTPGNSARLGGDNTDEYADTRINAKLIATPIKNLVLNGEFTFDQLNRDYSTYSKNFPFAGAYDFDASYSASAGSTLSMSKYRTNYTALNLYGSYNLSLADAHNFTVLAGYNVEARHYTSMSANRSKMINDDLPALELAIDPPNVYQDDDEYTLMGIFGRFNYNYKSRYLFEVNARYDGSSKFPTSYRWGLFPSFSAGWRISEESFMSGLKHIIPEMKLRASYATIGNQNVGNYGFIPKMDPTKPNWLYQNGKVVSLGMPPMVRTNFTWETVQTENIGLDLSLLRNKLTSSFELYRRKTKDMLYEEDEYPAVVGTSAPNQNVAELKSQGFEIELKWKDQIGKVAYHLGVNLYNYNAWITKIKNESGSLSRYYVGQHMGLIWGYTTDRFYTADDFESNGSLKPGIAKPSNTTPLPGDILFVDKDGDGLIQNVKNTIYDSGDLSPIGNSSLRLQYGINGGISWKNIDFSFFIEGVGKRDVYLNNDLRFPLYYEHGGIFKNELDYWTPDNTDAYFPRLYQTGASNANYVSNTRTQTKYLLNGAYLRVKNITLSYTLPRTMTTKWGINNIRLFSSLENPFMFHHLPKGIDPTVNNKSRGLGYPVMKVYSFGISLEL